MNYINEKLEDIVAFLNGLSDEELVQRHNEFCESMDYHDDQIFHNDEEFFEVHFSDVMSAVRAISYGEYNYQDPYVVFNGYANLESFSNPSNRVDIEAIAEDILENPHNYYDIELEEVEEEDED